jgi:hypothetical protein
MASSPFEILFGIGEKRDLAELGHTSLSYGKSGEILVGGAIISV